MNPTDFAKSPRDMDWPEFEAASETANALLRAYEADITAARAVLAAWAARPACVTVGDLEAAATDDPALAAVLAADRRVQVRVAELEHTMIERGWWVESQRTILITDDGKMVMRLPESAGIHP